MQGILMFKIYYYLQWKSSWLSGLKHKQMLPTKTVIWGREVFCPSRMSQEHTSPFLKSWMYPIEREKRTLVKYTMRTQFKDISYLNFIYDLIESFISDQE